MEEFKPITTQAEFDAAIGERLKRERETLSKKYGDYDDLKTKVADYEKQIGQLTRAAEDAAKKYAGHDKELADLQAKVKGYETDSVKTRIAHEAGLPYELAGRLTGEDEAAHPQGMPRPWPNCWAARPAKRRRCGTPNRPAMAKKPPCVPSAHSWWAMNNEKECISWQMY